MSAGGLGARDDPGGSRPAVRVAELPLAERAAVYRALREVELDTWRRYWERRRRHQELLDRWPPLP